MDRLPTEALDSAMQLAAFQIIRRNGAVVAFDPNKIAVAMTKAFLAVEGRQGAASSRVRDIVARLTDTVVGALTRRLPDGGMLHIEDIQDQVELALMRSGEHDVARAYVLYRERRAAERAAQKDAEAQAGGAGPVLHVVDGEARRPLDRAALLAVCREACTGLDGVSADTVLEHALHNLYDGVPIAAVRQALVLAARTLIEREPDYGRVAARLLLSAIRVEVLGHEASQADMADPDQGYAACLPAFIRRGIEAELLDPRLADFDLARLAAAIRPERDLQFDYLGLQTLYDRYFLHVDDRRIELPQTFFMRVAMGLAINEIDREAQAIAFYELLSSFDFMSSTPTLFNSGTRHSQLSSCYLTTVADSLEDIYQSIKENALLQKFAGGLGNDWTPVRALGSRIKGTNGQSQGVIPFLKVVNDTAVAVNQGGKRKGAVCAYLETWHLDIEDFLELRKNTGDERRRTHDMNTANWIPDLFMKRVLENAEWTLFSPVDVPDLHERYGQDFEAAYRAYEEKAERGEIRLFKRLPALQLWRKMLTMLFETGHPWLTFKDACNLRSPQQHVGVVPAQPVHRDHAQHLGRRDRGVQPRLGEPARSSGARRRRALDARPRQTAAHRARRDAPARQRHRPQLLRHAQGARRQPAPPPGGPGHHGLCRRLAHDGPGLRIGRRGRVRRPFDGSRLPCRLLGLDRAGRGTRAVFQLPRQPVGPGPPAAGQPRAAGRGPRPQRRRRRRPARSRPLLRARLGPAARTHRPPWHAQLELRRHRTDRDDLNIVGGRPRSSRTTRTCTLIQPVGRVHRGQRAFVRG